jgi:pentatricopeptide repeat protein
MFCCRKCQNSPESWARCLCGTCHTLYFMVLPSMLSLNAGKEKAILQQAYELLVRATQQGLACDEVCYRLMMQLCGEHSRPLLAVKLLVIMKKFGIQPNALTYGYVFVFFRLSAKIRFFYLLQNVCLGPIEKDKQALCVNLNVKSDKNANVTS